MLKRSGKLMLFGIVFLFLSSFSTLALVNYPGDDPWDVYRVFHLDQLINIVSFLDSLGQENATGVNLEEVDIIDAQIGKGITMDGTNEYFNTNIELGFNDAWTIAIRVRASDNSSNKAPFGTSDEENANGWYIYSWAGTPKNLKFCANPGTPAACHYYRGAWGNITKDHQWHTLMITKEAGYFNSTNIDLYVDGKSYSSIGDNDNRVTTNASLDHTVYIGWNGNTGWGVAMDIDEVIIDKTGWNLTRVLAYNETDYGIAPYVQPGADYINFTGLNPLNNTQYGFNTLNFNTSVDSKNAFTARLYFNGTLNQTRTFSAGKSVFVSFNATFPDASYNFHINASETSNATRNDTTGINIFYVDSTFPSVITGFQTNSIFFKNFLIANFNLTDNFELFSYNVSINGIQKDYLTDLNRSFYRVNFTYNLENYSVGVYNLSIYVSDGHTAKFIPDWDHSSNPLTKSLTYNFDDDWVKIIPQGFDFFDSFNTYKKFDRYNFNHDRAFFSEKQIYIVRSNKKIVIIKNSRFPGWLIIPSLNKWIDFAVEQSYKDISVKVISDFEVEITIDGLKEKDLTFNSIGELNTITKSYQFFKGNITTSLTTPVLETESTSYQVSFEINSSFITDINATLNRNGTLHSPDTKTAAGKYINFSYSRMIPLKNQIISLQINWNYTIYGINNTEVNSSDNQTQLILDFSLNSCNQSHENVTLVLIPRNEENDLPIQNVSVDISLDIFLDQSNITKKTATFNFTGIGDPNNGYNYSICLEPKNYSFLIDAFIDYEKTSFSQRNYFLRKYIIGTNNISKVYLYLINDSIDSDVTIEITNEEDDPLVEYFVKVLRYYPGNNSFKTIEIGRTSNEGKSLVRLIQNDVWYKFIVNDDNTTIFISNVQKVLSTTLFLQIVTGESFLSTIEKVQSLDYSFTYNNDTGVYLFIWNDRNNIVREGRLRVVQKGVGDTVVCDEGVSSTAGSISCTINTSIDAIFIGTAYIDTKTKNSLFPLKIIETYLLEEFARFGVLGLFIQIMILNVLVGIGLWRPSGALIFAAVAVIIGGVTGLVGITYGTIVVLVALLLLFIGLIRD